MFHDALYLLHYKPHPSAKHGKAHSIVECSQRMLENSGSRLHATAHAGALAELQRAGLTRLPTELTAAWVALADDRKYSRDIGV